MYKRSIVTEGEGHTGFWWQDMRESDLFEKLDTDSKTIIRWIFKKCKWGDTDWIDLAQDKNRSSE
jgi:uncharacterized protein YjcR